MGRMSFRDRCRVEAQTFFNCLASDTASAQAVFETVVEPCAVCFGDLGCEACGGSCEIRTSRPVQMPHPADSWTLRSLLPLSINGSFT